VSILHLDFETKSTVDLKKVGLHVYATHPDTDVIVACYTFDEGPVRTWWAGQACPSDVRDHIEAGREVWAHNAAFERVINNCVMHRRYGWPKISIHQVRCTSAMAYAMALPGSLDGASAALGVDQRKDMAGSRLMLQMCQPRDVSPTGKVIWWDEDKEKLGRLGAYCAQDVVVERVIGHRMMPLSPYEQKVYQLDQVINDRGIGVDVPAIKRALEIIDDEKARLTAEIQKVSMNQVATPTAVQQIKDFLSWRMGVSVEGLAKNDVTELLDREGIPSDCRRVLEIRQEAGKAATSKLEPMLVSAGRDHRVRGTFQYTGASTRRWAGRRVQLHNLKRPGIKQEHIDRLLDSLSCGRVKAHEIDLLYGKPLEVLAECIRAFICAPLGRDLIACDFSAIEARVLAWLAGQESTLEVFRTHGKIYEQAASFIFTVPINAIVDWQRQVGKVAVLALGYQGGVGAFSTMAKGYGVSMAPAYPTLLAQASAEHREKAIKNWQENGKRYDLPMEEFIASDLTKLAWREANPDIVRFWYSLENAAIAAIQNPKIPQQVRGITYLVNGSFLWCKLPGGGVICYPYPSLDEKKTPWGEIRPSIVYKSEDISRKWVRTHTYGGSLAENVTQAVARDLLADAMLRLEAKGYPVVAHVHDEVICEVPKSFGSVEEMSQIMCANPDWARTLPIAAGGWRGKRYRK